MGWTCRKKQGEPYPKLPVCLCCMQHPGKNYKKLTVKYWFLKFDSSGDSSKYKETAASESTCTQMTKFKNAPLYHSLNKKMFFSVYLSQCKQLCHESQAENSERRRRFGCDGGNGVRTIPGASQRSFGGSVRQSVFSGSRKYDTE